MQFRVRDPNGKNNIVKLDEKTATIQDLRDAISRNLLDPEEEFALTFGFPPKTITLTSFANEQSLSDAGLKLHNESIQVNPIATSDQRPPSIATTKSQAGPSSGTVEARKPAQERPKQPKPSNTKRVAATTATSPMTDQDVPSIPLPSHSASLTLRIMPDDNSCLFRAIAAAVHQESSSDYVSLLRYQVANYVTSNPSLYSTPVLDGRTPEAYAAWIQQESSWGGDVELDVLSRVLGLEIWCCQVDPFFVRRYNETSTSEGASGSGEFIALVYSGIHYDTVAVSPSLEDILPPEFDMSKFSGTDDRPWVLDATKALCEKLKERGYMTNTSSFGIMCKVEGCGWVGQGEKAAVEHAKSRGHTDLEEIT